MSTPPQPSPDATLDVSVETAREAYDDSLEYLHLCHRRDDDVGARIAARAHEVHWQNLIAAVRAEHEPSPAVSESPVSISIEDAKRQHLAAVGHYRSVREWATTGMINDAFSKVVATCDDLIAAVSAAREDEIALPFLAACDRAQQHCTHGKRWPEHQADGRCLFCVIEIGNGWRDKWIDDKGSRDQRIAELEGEIERLTKRAEAAESALQSAREQIETLKATIRNIRLTAAAGRSFGHQATPQTHEKMAERKDARLDQILEFCADAGESGSILRTKE